MKSHRLPVPVPSAVQLEWDPARATGMGRTEDKRESPGDSEGGTSKLRLP